MLGFAFYGSDKRSLSLEVTGSSLSALNGLVRVMAADKFADLGDRGPVPVPSDLEPLELVDVLFGSTAFYFAPGASEELRLPVEAGGTASRIAVVGQEVVRLIEASSDDKIVDLANRYHPRVAARYVDLLEVLSSGRSRTGWLAAGASASLSEDDANRALGALERTEELSTRETRVFGTLYEANARSRGFRLQRDEDGSILVGRFAEHLVDKVGALWNQPVLAVIDVTTERLVRTGKERLRFTLTGLETP